MKNIVLIGMMGSGKTTCGKALSVKLRRPLTDTDDLIAQREGIPVPEIFARHGEGYFRSLELATAREVGKDRARVIATGGGMILQQDAVTALREQSVVVFLNRQPEEIFDSVAMDGRPMAQGGREKFIETFQFRKPKYRGAAHVVIDDFSTVDHTVDAILTALKNLGELI